MEPPIALRFTPLACCLPLAALALAQAGNIGVTNAASFERGLPARGSLATIFGTGLVVPRLTVADRLPLPTTLAGVSVTIGGAAAPIQAVADAGG